ncbi:MAG TPA: ArsA-related P-loop ATPase [Patescibacteria group bacterium]|nr:ArsA-related P-loop ATPase [Patescibacteria group bacterium]
MKRKAHSGSSANLDALDGRQQSLVICLGPGGVGKTTISAALAVRAAALGSAVDVMTVDPAPRLLDALGLDSDSSEPVDVHIDGVRHGCERHGRERHGHERHGRQSHERDRHARRGAHARSRLRALRLDPKRTFDSIVARYAVSDAARTTILENRIYRNLSGALAGVADYMAMEKLLELAANPDTDLIVLDTPPAAEAIDFLGAPRRLLELLNSRAVTLLSAPSGIFRSQLRMVDVAARAVLATFDRVTGLHLLADVQSFVRSFDGMYEGFSDRATRAQDKLRAADTSIVIVTTAESSRIAQAREFVEALEEAGLRISAMVVNRVLTELPDASELASAPVAPALRKKLKRNLADYAALKEREEVSLNALRKSLPEGAVLMVAPDLGREPRTIADLAEIGGSIHAG